MTDRRMTFQGAAGRLSARLSLPADGKASAYALFAHCFTCGKDLKPVVNVARALASRGIAVLRFDFTGLGESEGDFEDTDFSSNVGDLVAAAEFMARELEAPTILVGHSLGGTAVLRAAADIPSARAVCTVAAPHDPGHVTHLFTHRLDEIEERGSAEVELAGRRFTVTRDFVEDLTEQRMDEAIRDLGRPLLVFHSPRDRIVGVEHAARIYQAAKHPKSFVSLDDADHLLLDRRDSGYVADVLSAWARRYVDYGPEASSVEELRGQNAVVSRTAAGSYRTDISTRGHALVADEPSAVGGEDSGPSPYDLLAAALGACTTMTLRMYAERKGWPLQEAYAYLEHERVHAEDEERCPDAEPRLDRLRREVGLVGDLDQEQRARLLEIANRCPVHRTLSAGVRIETALVEPGPDAAADG